jgi:hypothetical protein
LEYNVNSKQARLETNNSYNNEFKDKNNNNILKYLSAHTTKQIQKNKFEKIQSIKALFSYEYDQVEKILRVIWLSKFKKYPLGMKMDDIAINLSNMDEYNNCFESLFNSSKTYLLSLLNTLAQPPINILELRPHDSTFDITHFGIEYHREVYIKIN